MVKMTLHLDEDVHEDLRELAHRQETTMAALLRYALDKTFEDDLDVIGAERALEEARRDPSSTMSFEELKERMARRGPDRARKARSGTREPNNGDV